MGAATRRLTVDRPQPGVADRGGGIGLGAEVALCQPLPRGVLFAAAAPLAAVPFPRKRAAAGAVAARAADRAAVAEPELPGIPLTSAPWGVHSAPGGGSLRGEQGRRLTQLWPFCPVTFCSVSEYAGHHPGRSRRAVAVRGEGPNGARSGPRTGPRLHARRCSGDRPAPRKRVVGVNRVARRRVNDGTVAVGAPGHAEHEHERNAALQRRHRCRHWCATRNEADDRLQWQLQLSLSAPTPRRR